MIYFILLISQFHMGSSSSQAKLNYDIDIMSDYKEIKRDHNGIHLLHHQSQLTYLLKEYNYASDLQYEQERYKYEREIEEGVYENVLSVSKIKTHTIHGLCSTSFKIYVIYQYPQVTLQDEIQARQKEEKRFDEHELWSILQSCNVALSQLKPIISLNGDQVFITPEGLLKVIHNDMIDQNYRYSLNPKYFYAPEKIRNFNRMDNQLSLIKQSVFSMGMTLLQAALLELYVDCYDFNQKLFLEVNLANLIESVAEVYSSDFIEILQSMLSINPQDRPAYHEIQRLLDNFWSHQSVVDPKIESSMKNGQSLNIQGEIQKKIIFTSQDDRGIINNLATINSHQKESGHFDQFKPKNMLPRVAVSIQESSNEDPSRRQSQSHSIRQTLSFGHPHSFGNKQSRLVEYKHQEQSKSKQSLMNKQGKENVYTDPRLLQMIKKDLEDINKLKQSTLKQTIKYSFLYPQTQSIFNSINDIKLSMKHDQFNTHQRSDNTLQEINSNSITKKSQNIKEFTLQQKLQQLNHNKQSFIERQNQLQMKKMKKSLQRIEHYQGLDEEGRLYQGQRLNQQKHGWGKLLFADGAFYQGEFKQNQINGRGILYYCQGKPAYDGMWVHQKFHGKGILYNQRPEELNQPFNFYNLDEVQNYWLKYEGQFIEDSKQGLGKLYLTNGEMIEGRFAGDSVDGECIFTNWEGKQLHGIWQQNHLIRLLPLS